MAALTVGAIVRNEAGGFLASALESWKHFADDIFVLDDGSSDETTDLLKDAGVEFVSRSPSDSGTERKRHMWELMKTRGWYLMLDADETMSDDPRPHLKAPATGFRVYDLWDDGKFREDAWWIGQKSCWRAAVHMPSFKNHEDEWPAERVLHSDYLPSSLPRLYYLTPPSVSIMHYAYSTPQLRASKHERYLAKKEHLTPAELFHARTIVTPNPRLLDLPFKVRWPLSLPT